jgi:hypothetical protein
VQGSGRWEEFDVYRHCLFCRTEFRKNRILGHLPRGRNFAFDPVRGRLWAICRQCHRWNLIPVEDRGEALHELERLARDHARIVSETAHVALMRTRELDLVRVGAAGLSERAWWRYGTELRRRRHQTQSPSGKISAYTFGAMAYLGQALGLTDMHMGVTWESLPTADIQRWRKFGWAAWYGRVTCPHCSSVLTTMRFDLSWWLYPTVGEDGSVSLGVPCPRCDPWTPEKIYTVDGPDAATVLRRVLAYQHITGAGEGMLADASRIIEDQGSIDAFMRSTARGDSSLWRLGPTRSVALEIALNESVERRMVDLEILSLEHMWRREEELARVIDEELT